jgi:hypothetical protein
MVEAPQRTKNVDERKIAQGKLSLPRGRNSRPWKFEGDIRSVSTIHAMVIEIRRQIWGAENASDYMKSILQPQESSNLNEGGNHLESLL